MCVWWAHACTTCMERCYMYVCCGQNEVNIERSRVGVGVCLSPRFRRDQSNLLLFLVHGYVKSTEWLIPVGASGLVCVDGLWWMVGGVDVVFEVFEGCRRGCDQCLVCFEWMWGLELRVLTPRRFLSITKTRQLRWYESCLFACLSTHGRCLNICLSVRAKQVCLKTSFRSIM